MRMFDNRNRLSTPKRALTEELKFNTPLMCLRRAYTLEADEIAQTETYNEESSILPSTNEKTNG